METPFYAIDASKESNNSGESPLFEHRLLAPSRLEQKLTTEEYVKDYLPSKKKTSRPNSGVQYYRPESPHQYLPATARQQEDPSVKYGRPTRTTLLRARNRCNSAPLNMFKLRKEVQKQYEQKLENRRPQTATITVKDLLSTSVSQGETINSFLIGARYNRAHCLDSKSMAEHGVYMPRGNPLGCFITRDRLKEGADDLPATPPDSLMSNSDNEEEPPRPKQKQAWAAGQTERKKITKHDITLQHYINTEDGLNVKGSGADANSHSKPGTKKHGSSSRPNSSRVSHHRHAAPRAQSARLPSQQSNATSSARGVTKPFVLIQGKSLPRGTRSALEQTAQMSVRRPNTSRDASSVSLNSASTRQRVKSASGKTPRGADAEHQCEWERENGVASPVSSVHFRPRSSHDGNTRQQGPTVNGVVNMPLIADQNDVDITPIRNEIEAVFDLRQNSVCSDADKISTSVENGAPSDIKEDVTVTTEPSIGESELQKRSENIEQKRENAVEADINGTTKQELPIGENGPLGSKRTSKVRFADEIEEIECTEGGVTSSGKDLDSQVGQGDNAVFFITEDREESSQNSMAATSAGTGASSSWESKDGNKATIDVARNDDVEREVTTHGKVENVAGSGEFTMENSQNLKENGILEEENEPITAENGLHTEGNGGTIEEKGQCIARENEQDRTQNGPSFVGNGQRTEDIEINEEMVHNSVENEEITKENNHITAENGQSLLENGKNSLGKLENGGIITDSGDLVSRREHNIASEGLMVDGKSDKGVKEINCDLYVTQEDGLDHQKVDSKVE